MKKVVVKGGKNTLVLACFLLAMSSICAWLVIRVFYKHVPDILNLLFRYREEKKDLTEISSSEEDSFFSSNECSDPGNINVENTKKPMQPCRLEAKVVGGIDANKNLKKEVSENRREHLAIYKKTSKDNKEKKFKIWRETLSKIEKNYAKWNFNERPVQDSEVLWTFMTAIECLCNSNLIKKSTKDYLNQMKIVLETIKVETFHKYIICYESKKSNDCIYEINKVIFSRLMGLNWNVIDTKASNSGEINIFGSIDVKPLIDLKVKKEKKIDIKVETKRNAHILFETNLQDMIFDVINLIVYFTEDIENRIFKYLEWVKSLKSEINSNLIRIFPLQLNAKNQPIYYYGIVPRVQSSGYKLPYLSYEFVKMIMSALEKKTNRGGLNDFTTQLIRHLSNNMFNHNDSENIINVAANNFIDTINRNRSLLNLVECPTCKSIFKNNFSSPGGNPDNGGNIVQQTHKNHGISSELKDKFLKNVHSGSNSKNTVNITAKAEFSLGIILNLDEEVTAKYLNEPERNISKNGMANIDKVYEEVWTEVVKDVLNEELLVTKFSNSLKAKGIKQNCKGFLDVLKHTLSYANDGFSKVKVEDD